jgi:hypothetical protein
MSVRSADFWQGDSTVVPSTLRGYRTWRVAGGGLGARLASTAMAHVWAQPEVTAACMQETAVGPVDQACPCVFCAEPLHNAPADGCACGIYGWYDPRDSRLIASDVFGAIEVSGRVVLATHGFRAEKARVVAIAIEPRRYPARLDLVGGSEASREQLHALAQWGAAQGIPVFASQSELVAAFPPDDVSGLVEHECGEQCSAGRRRYGFGGSIPPSSTMSAATAAAVGLAAALDAAAASSAYAVEQLERSVAPWKRWLLAALCAAGALICVVGTVAALLGLIRAAEPDQAVLQAGLASFNALGVVLNIRLTRRAWRWGR